jgi:hypothetical protein
LQGIEQATSFFSFLWNPSEPPDLYSQIILRSIDMKRSSCLIFGVFAVILAVTAGTSYAQSTNRDNPTPMSSSEVSGTYGDHQKDGNREVFYSFTAGPGELTITFDVKRRNRDDGPAFTFELLPANGSSTALLCCEGAQGGDGGTGREVAHVKLTRRQTIILHVTNTSNGGGIFNARFSGQAVSSFGGGTGGGPGKVVDSGGDSRTGESVIVPSSGTLHIRMKDGSTKDIDLSLIRNISVRQ